MFDDAQRRRVIAARMRLKERFEPSQASTLETPQGTGPPNRHGLPQVPVGQTVTERWPILDLGESRCTPITVDGCA
ncbi:MAG: hypothetical protein AAGA48_16690 [Myxococcota bacterium]